MKALVTLGLVLSLCFPAVAEPRPVIIKMDLGGWIPHYKARAEKYAKQGRRIVIDGDCRSACTYYLWTRYNLDICVTPRARLMFHMPFWRTGEGRYDVEATPARVEWSSERWRAMLTEYPPAIAKKIANVPNPSKIKDARVYKTLSGRELFNVVKPC